MKMLCPLSAPFRTLPKQVNTHRKRYAISLLVTTQDPTRAPSKTPVYISRTKKLPTVRFSTFRMMLSRIPASFLRTNQSSQRRSISQWNMTYPRQQMDWSRWRIQARNQLKRKRLAFPSGQWNLREMAHQRNHPRSLFGFPKLAAFDHLFENGTPCCRASPVTKASTTIISPHTPQVTKTKLRQRDMRPFPTSSNQAIPSRLPTTTRFTGKTLTRR